MVGQEKRARRVATLDAAWVTALVARPDGTLVAGTTPGGRLFSIDPKTGNARPMAALGTDHVWALALDRKSGVLYAGTGGPGKIFSVDTSGHAKELWDSGDRHVVSLLQDDATHLYAGTSEEAILYRVGLDGHAEAIADFDAEEVRALARVGRHALRRRERLRARPRRRSRPTPQPQGARGTRITVAPSGSPASAGSLPRPGQRKAKGALIRIGRDGRTEQVFAIGDGYLTSIAFDDDGARVRRNRDRGARLPGRPRSNGRAGDRLARAAGAGAAAHRQDVPGRHWRRGRRLSCRTGRGAAGDVPVARAGR